MLKKMGTWSVTGREDDEMLSGVIPVQQRRSRMCPL